MHENTSKVACKCDTVFHHSVLFPELNDGIFRCVHCGTTTYSITRGNDGRDGNESYTIIYHNDMEKDALEWLSKFPTCLHHNETLIFFPAKKTFSTIKNLEKEICNEYEKTKTHSLYEKMHNAGIPKETPPQNIPQDCLLYKDVWDALQCNNETSMEILLQHALKEGYPFAVVKNLILQHKEIEKYLLQWMKYIPTQEYWYTSNAGEPYFLAHNILRSLPTVSTTLKNALREEMKGLSLDVNPYDIQELQNHYRLQSCLQTIVTLKMNDEETLTLLQSLKKAMPNPYIKSIEHLKEALQKLKINRKTYELT